MSYGHNTLLYGSASRVEAAQGDDVEIWDNGSNNYELWHDFSKDDLVMSMHAVRHIEPPIPDFTQGSPGFPGQMATLFADSMPTPALQSSVETYSAESSFDYCNLYGGIVDQFGPTRNGIDFDTQRSGHEADIGADPIDCTTGISSSLTAHHPTTPAFVPGCTSRAVQSYPTSALATLHSAGLSGPLPPSVQLFDVLIPITPTLTPARSRAQYLRNSWNCPRCHRLFKHPSYAERRRHEDTHNDNSSWYECCCGYQCRGTRKDNYRRHLDKCTKAVQLSSFKCKCKMLFRDKRDHVQHIGKCGVGRPGRRCMRR